MNPLLPGPRRLPQVFGFCEIHPSPRHEDDPIRHPSETGTYEFKGQPTGLFHLLPQIFLH